jgi:hypothetical protein
MPSDTGGWRDFDATIRRVSDERGWSGRQAAARG